MTYAIEARATTDPEGKHSLPTLIGPFDSADRARTYMATTFPSLFGHWGLAFIESPAFAARLTTATPERLDAGNE